MAFILHRSLTKALFAFFAGIPTRVGYDTKGRGFLLTHPIAPPNEFQMHRSEYYFNLIEQYGVKVNDRNCELRVDLVGLKNIDLLLNKSGIENSEPFIVVNPGGNWDLKRWPKEKFALLIQRIIRELKLKVVISGAATDEELVNQIVQLSKVKPIMLAGKTTIKETIALFSRAAVLVSSDSGPLHLASSVGARTIGIFGPTRPELTGPRGKGSIVNLQEDVGCNYTACYFLQCPDNVCMKSVSVSQVFNEVLKIKQNYEARTN